MMFFRRPIEKSPQTNNYSNLSLLSSTSIDKENDLSLNDKTTNKLTSTYEHLLEKHPGLLRLFDSKICTISMIISYLFSSKEPVVQEFLGRKLFEYPDNQVDFYLPQIINMYIHIQSISNVIHNYLTTRCSKTVEFSLQCTWLLDAYIVKQMKIQKIPNNAIQFLFDILSEKYKPKIIYTSNKENNLTVNNCYNFPLNEEENENGINDQQNFILDMNKKRKHKKSISDVSENSSIIINGEINKQQHRRQTRLFLGDLNSGHAFDDNCFCFEKFHSLQQQECTCNASRLAPEREFTAALINIGKKLPHVPTKEKKTQHLISQMKRMNMNLPARIWIPFYTFPHHIVRIAYSESAVLNSRDRAPYIIYIEVVHCDNVFASPLPRKQNDSKLHSTKSEENLNHSLLSINPYINVDYLNSETRSLDAELIDSYRSYINSDDGDIWSTSDEIIGDDQQQSLQKRSGFLNFRSHIVRMSPNHSDSQSIQSTDSQQEIMPSDIRKRLKEVNSTGTIVFDRDPDDPSAATLKEPWDKKEQRIRQSSPYGHLKNWHLVAVIVKYGDDLRHELLAYQFMVKLKEIWLNEHVPLFVRPINILVLSNNSGLIEPILNAVSLHQIKKNSKLSLRNYFLKEFGNEHSEEFLTAVKNFVQSCSAYSIICYLLQVKDRHNGNILLDSEGHIIHIDFGYMLSSTPKNLGFESSPFKITQEFVDIMGGLQSDMYKYYKILILRGLIAARKHIDQLMPIVEIMQQGSQLNCFSKGNVTLGLRERFHLNMTDEQLEFDVEKMVESSLNSLTTRVYDTFQYYTSGISK